MKAGGATPAPPRIELSWSPTDAEFAAVFTALERETAPVTGPCHIVPLALLLRNAAAARSRSRIGIQLSWLDFQAPAFYERLGFSTFGVQDDVPPGHRCFYLLKRLS